MASPETALRSISLEINKMGQETGQFRRMASQQNNSISSFIRDIAKLFTTNTNQQGQLNNSISDLQQTSAQTGQKVDQTNYLMQNSISIQTQMLNEMKNSSSTLKDLYNLTLNNSNMMANQQGLLNGGGGGILGNIARMFLGGAALGAGAMTAADLFGENSSIVSGVMGAQQTLSGGMSNFTNMFSGGDETPNLTGASPTSIGGGGGRDSGGTLSTADMSNYARQAGFTEEQARIMGAIGRAESGGNYSTDTVQSGLDTQMNREFSIGWAQINWQAHQAMLSRNGITSPDQLRDPATNARAAKLVFDEAHGSFSPWSTYKNGAYSRYLERDESFAPPGSISPITTPTLNSYNNQTTGFGGSGVHEKQSELAGIRKLPLNPKLKSILDQAAAAAGVEAVVYSGGQPEKGKGGPRTGSTRHDNGNAADLYLMKDGRKLSDTNPQDKAIMAKFVSAAVAGGATGVGAGHDYMGPSNIHVGFGKQATWGGADWIKQAASGIFNNMDLSGRFGGNYGGETGGANFNFGGGVGGGGQGFNMGANISPLSLAMPMISLAMPMMGMTPLSGLFDMIGGLTGMFGGLMGNAFSSGLGGGSGDENSFEPDSYNNRLADNEESINKKTNSIQNAAMESDAVKFAPQQVAAQQPPSYPQQVAAASPINTSESYTPMHGSTSSPAWYLQLAGRIHNDEAMKFKGGVYA